MGTNRLTDVYIMATPYYQERCEVKNSKENTEEGLHLSIRWQGSEATTTKCN